MNKEAVLLSYYRPQRSCGQGYVFTRVCDSVHRGGRGSPENPPGTRQTPPIHPGRENPPGPGRHPPRPRRTPRTRQTPPNQGEPPRQGEHPPPQQGEPPPPGPRRTPPPAGRTPPRPGRPPREEDCSIRSMSGRYASYWNAFLSYKMLYCVPVL